MEKKATQSTILAEIISKSTNPCILSVAILLLIALTNSDSTFELASWIAIIVAFFVLIPVVYLYVKMS